jgi:hypothetical protein
MTLMIFVNRWGTFFHVFLSVNDDEMNYVLASRICPTLAEAVRVVEQWTERHGVSPENVRDNSTTDLAVLMAGVEPTDFAAENN